MGAEGGGLLGRVADPFGVADEVPGALDGALPGGPGVEGGAWRGDLGERDVGEPGRAFGEERGDPVPEADDGVPGPAGPLLPRGAGPPGDVLGGEGGLVRQAVPGEPSGEGPAGGRRGVLGVHGEVGVAAGALVAELEGDDGAVGGSGRRDDLVGDGLQPGLGLGLDGRVEQAGQRLALGGEDGAVQPLVGGVPGAAEAVGQPAELDLGVDEGTGLEEDAEPGGLGQFQQSDDVALRVGLPGEVEGAIARRPEERVADLVEAPREVAGDDVHAESTQGAQVAGPVGGGGPVVRVLADDDGPGGAGHERFGERSTRGARGGAHATASSCGGTRTTFRAAYSAPGTAARALNASSWSARAKRWVTTRSSGSCRASSTALGKIMLL